MVSILEKLTLRPVVASAGQWSVGARTFETRYDACYSGRGPGAAEACEGYDEAEA